MSTYYLESLMNSTLIEVISLYAHDISAYFTESVDALIKDDGVLSVFEHFPEYLRFDEFQLKLLQAFLILLIINLVLIFLAWNYYGKNICERFMKPATSKAIEELKASVSRLKLPKEHTPRI